jgi:two-component system, OmpR family, sensor kinase
MSLRLRLTLLYTSLLGGVLLIFGALVYGMVSVVLLDQIDATLEQSAERIITRLRVQPPRILILVLWKISNRSKI